MAQPMPPQSTTTVIIDELGTPINKIETPPATAAGNDYVSTGIKRVTNLYDPEKGIAPNKINANVDVAIIDSGIDIKHSDLNVYKNVVFAQNAISADDNCDHGTGLAGIVGAKYNHMGVVGIAPGARLWSVKILELNYTSGKCEGSVRSAIEGVNYVTKHANEIDIAMIGFGFKGNSRALNEAIDRAVAAGVTIIVPAGNTHEDVSQFSPANSMNVITVSAIVDTDGKCGGYGRPAVMQVGNTQVSSNDDVFAPFSNYGKKLDIAAPGYKIFTTGKNSTWTTMSGTTPAAAIVAGAAALYKSDDPRLSPSDIYRVLRSSGSTINTICDGNSHGYFKGYINNPALPLLHIEKSILYFLHNNIPVEPVKDPTIQFGIRLASDPSALAINPNTKRIYVANRGSETISVIDELTNGIVGNVSLNSIPVSLAINPNTNRLYVANAHSNTISIVDTITNKVIMDKAQQPTIRGERG